MDYNLKIISSTTRPGRNGPIIANWIAEETNNHGSFDTELSDLGEIRLPVMNEANHPGLIKYEHDQTKKWGAGMKVIKENKAVSNQIEINYKK
ncbi:MAG TPA: NAD(P)H-dependent oxidoreductase [Balneolaceae bacterium]|nr:NAD(P)H-dependent oxidoreductase [Balneolaceae bacterium]